MYTRTGERVLHIFKKFINYAFRGLTPPFLFTFGAFSWYFKSRNFLFKLVHFLFRLVHFLFRLVHFLFRLVHFQKIKMSTSFSGTSFSILLSCHQKLGPIGSAVLTFIGKLRINLG